MSRTYKHIGKGLWNNNIQDNKRFEIKKYLFYCRRRNRENSYFLELRIKLKEKIINKEMTEQLLNR